MHDSKYRLRGRPATYCLASKGIAYLRETTELDQTTLRNFYKNKRLVSENEQLVDRCLLVFRLFNIFKARTGERFRIYTKYEMDRDDYPKPLPDLQLVAKEPDKPGYLLDIFPAGTMTWLLRKRLRQHQEFAEDSEYQYPDVLLIAGNVHTEKRLFKLVENALQDFEFQVTQQTLLLDENDGKIWIDLDESDEDTLDRVGLW
jgi:hypothetical protein